MVGLKDYEEPDDAAAGSAQKDRRLTAGRLSPAGRAGRAMAYTRFQGAGRLGRLAGISLPRPISTHPASRYHGADSLFDFLVARGKLGRSSILDQPRSLIDDVGVE